MISSKLPNTGTTIFAVMSGMAAEHGALNLSQGFPDFNVSPELIDLVNQAMQDGHNQYAPMTGSPLLLKQIETYLRNTYQWNGDALSEVTVTAGATEALYACITALVHPGDEVIILEPAYDSYKPVIELSGGKCVSIELEPGTYSIPWEKLASSINRQTRMLIINSPHNPTGMVLSKSDIEKIEQLAVEHDFLVISDEVYDRIIFDGKSHHSVLQFEELRKRSMSVFSFGKTFHITGWKSGYVVAPEELTKEIRKVHQFLTYSVNTPVQVGLSNYMKDPNNYLNLPEFYQKKRDYFLDLISGSRFKPIQCRGTYFQLLSYEDISDEDEMDMATRMTKEFKIASIPVSSFYTESVNNKILRFCFAKEEQTLERAAEILCRI